MTNVISFSGGRTSGYMLWRLLQQHGSLDGWRIMFANTGKERDETLDFVNEVQLRWGVQIAWVEYDRVPACDIDLDSVRPAALSHLRKCLDSGAMAHWQKIVNYETAHRNGQPDSPFDKLLSWMKVLPNPTSRACTAELKIRSMARHLWASGVTAWTDHIGIRIDESDRAADIRAMVPKYVTPAFPLIDLRVDAGEVMAFWKRQPFDLRLESYEGNCDLCFLKSLGKRVRLMKENPGMADWWIGWEKKAAVRIGGGRGARFRQDATFAQARYLAEHPNLFDEREASEDSGDACPCATKGYESLPR